MVFKRFRFVLIVRILLLTATIFVFVLLMVRTSFTLSIFTAGLLVLAQTISLIHYIDKTNRMLNNFLESIRYSDFSRTFHSQSLGGTFEPLQKNFNEVVQNFQKVKAEKEENFYYLQSVIQHIGIALLAFDKSGQIELQNNAARKLFQIKHLSHLDALKSFSPELVQKMQSLKHNENTLLKVIDQEEVLELAIYATEIKIAQKTILLVSIKNIQNELEEKEMEAWQKLISVLTHEIMNSIAPISSLSNTISSILMDIQEKLADKGREEQEALDDIQMAISTISKRADGLMHFVNTYRSLTRIPHPNLSNFKVKQLFQNLQVLLSDEIHQKNIECQKLIDPESMELWADERLIEQVLINLIKNAIHACEGRNGATIRLLGTLNKRGRPIIEVIDNGPGILPEVLDNIFIPFFTTKSNGSGIGLSLSKQIMRKHEGNLTVNSIPEQETRFTLTF